MVLPASLNKCEDFQKCGEITTAIGVGQKVYALNCMFCGKTFLQLETFAMHIDESHQKEMHTCFNVDPKLVDLKADTNSEFLDDISFDSIVDDLVEIIDLANLEFAAPLSQSLDNPVSSLTMIELKKEDVLNSKTTKSDDDEKAFEVNYIKENHGKMECNMKSALPLVELTISQNLKFIEIYKNYPCLWNEENIEYRFKNEYVINEILNKMVEEVNAKMNLHVTLEELQRKISCLRDASIREKNRKLEYERLKQDYKPSSNFYDKIAFLNDHVGPFKCDLCGEICTTMDKYKVHKSEHDGTMPFICPVCNRGFKSIGNCTTHLKEHKSDYMYECVICMKLFVLCNDLKIHHRVHTGVNPFFCEVCVKSFRSLTDFSRHLRRHRKLPVYQCTICARLFYDHDRLKQHTNIHLNVRDCVCKTCGKSFPSKKYLLQHKQLHPVPKEYQCKFCGKEFALYSRLNRHIKIHGTKKKK